MIGDGKRIVTFLRKKDLQFVKELGGGACGQTVVLHDDVIDEDFVCKKYAPFRDALRRVLFQNFVREIKILHLLNHKNVVRVFNYYLYPDQFAGYILMEHVDGWDIETYLKSHPDQASQIFLQVVDGFENLERSGILHRDIRPQNILVTKEGVAKIIDFGFGKRAAGSDDFDKSISLNWWCEPPLEFRSAQYDYRTEVYFVGKLFEKIINGAGVGRFEHQEMLERMCVSDPDKRVESFSKIRQELLAGKIAGIQFSDDELWAYRRFASHLSSAISKIESGAKLFDVDEAERRLEHLHRSVMLEEFIPSNSSLASCFVNGAYYYSRRHQVEVAAIEEFLDLLRRCARERKEVVMNNIFGRLDAIEKYEKKPLDFEDIPF